MSGDNGTRGGLLRRHRDFRFFWLGEVAARFGESVTVLAIPLLAASTLHVGIFEMGLLSAAPWLPWLLIGLPVGVWVDRMRRRPVMFWANVACFVLFASIPVASWTGVLGVGQLLVVALLAGTATVFFQTAYSVYLPGLLTPADQAEGNAKLHGSESAAQIVGLGVGGLLIQVAGAANGMLANTTTFLVSILCLSRIRYREPVPEPVERPRGALLKEIREGLRLVAHDAFLRSMTLFGAASNLALTGYQSILVLFLVREIGLSSGMVGALATFGGIGGVLGALLVRRVCDRLGTGRTLLLFQLGLPTLALLIPLTTPGAGLLLLLVGYLAVSVGVVAGNIIKSSFVQAYCPDGWRGRVGASASFLNYGTMPLGALLGGVLGSWLGFRPALWILTGGVPLAGLILYFSPIRRYRDLPTEPLTRSEPAEVAAAPA
ncbi:MFS transporter [Kitasatospora mediocidica]|uniref:MFS transporter n=1 Tax=Kitasatospora mediocidica TaxID=58352 RepID=UPI00056279B1|nr:MFS transporter [Kitasatospora mediocidica]